MKKFCWRLLWTAIAWWTVGKKLWAASADRVEVIMHPTEKEPTKSDMLKEWAEARGIPVVEWPTIELEPEDLVGLPTIKH